MSKLDEVVSKVQRILVKNFTNVTLDQGGNGFLLNQGSTRVWVTCMDGYVNPDSGDDDGVIVQVAALIADDLDPSPELYKEVATSVMGRAFGCTLRMWPYDNDTKYRVVLESRILGNFLDEAELKVAVLYAGLSADREDDGFAARHGGTVWNPDGNLD